MSREELRRPTEPLPPLQKVRRHLWVALTVNVAVVLPLSLLLAVISDRPFLEIIGSSLLVVFLFTNCNFLLLDGFYHAVWLYLGLDGAKAYLALGFLILPAAGALGTFFAIQAIALLLPGLLQASFGFLLSIGVLITVLAGLAFFGLEDNRRLRLLQERELAFSRERELVAEEGRLAAEIVAFQALIRPHFMFNTLTAIASLIAEAPKQAEEATLHLARLLRYVLEVQDLPVVSLEREIQVVTSYLEIEQIRLEDHLDYRIEVPDDCRQLGIPSLLLQPVVENAVRHGVCQRDTPGYVRIRAQRGSDHLDLEVADNGPGLDKRQFRTGSDTGTGTGTSMRLLRNRLEKLYGSNQEMIFERAGQETRLSFRLPIQMEAA